MNEEQYLKDTHWNQAVKSLIGAMPVMCVFEAMIANNVLHRPLLLQITHFLLEF